MQTLISQEFLIYLSVFMIPLATIVTLFLAPIDSHNRPLSNEERTKYRKLSMMLVLVLPILVMMFYIIKILNPLIFSIAYTYFIVALFLIFGKIKNKFIKSKEV